MSELPAVRFLRTLCGAVLRETPPAAAAASAREALGEVLSAQRSLVLEVQFTGFVAKGERLGGVEPAFLRAAGQLIMNRVSRIGFTPEARAEDLAALFEIAARPPAELGRDGIVGAVRAAAPNGIYLSTSTGEVYKPAAPAPAAETPAPAAEAPPRDEAPLAAEPAPAWGSGSMMPADDEENAELSTFEFVEEVAELSRAPAASAPAPAEPVRGEEPGANDMYHFFRASSSGGAQEDSAALPGLLHAEESMTRFDSLAESCARGALRHLREGDHFAALSLLEALAVEAERTDRTRLFRESATGALRSVGTSENLPHVVDLLQFVG
ncbi:MAG: hypothetical protein ICV87_01520, partial [Gemmatimonadetes bacterium]|nr:hypothetical protein [Gemmatimonadota bacterium]